MPQTINPPARFFQPYEGFSGQYIVGQWIEAGMTHINGITVQDFPHVMFGGEKNSGLGRFNGKWIIEELTTDHLITVQR